MKRIGIFGTSGHAREVGDVAVELGLQPVYIARDAAELREWSFPDEAVLESAVGQFQDMHFALGIGDNATRGKVAARYRGRCRFATLVHPSATFGARQREAVEAREGVVVCAGVRLSNNIRVGDFVIFNRNANVGHDVVVEDLVHVAPSACISGNVHLGAGCWVGASAVVNQGTPPSRLTIGAGTVIGSGAVVIGDCEPAAVYVGVPARRIK